MKKLNTGIIFLTFILLLVGCSDEEFSSTSSKPDAGQVLSEDNNSDIFQMNGYIYKTGIDWVEDEDVTKGRKTGEIDQVSKDSKSFQDGVATNLPKGTEIFSVNENDNILIAVVNGKEIKYLALSEG